MKRVVKLFENTSATQLALNRYVRTIFRNFSLSTIKKDLHVLSITRLYVHMSCRHKSEAKPRTNVRC